MLSTDEFNIKPASISDVEMFISAAGRSLASFRYFDTRKVQIIRNHILTLILTEGDKPVGYGHLDPENGKVWLGICIVESRVGNGLSKVVMDSLIEGAKAKHIKEIYLSVDDTNDQAIGLYNRYGFKKDSSKGTVNFMKLTL